MDPWTSSIPQSNLGGALFLIDNLISPPSASTTDFEDNFSYTPGPGNIPITLSSHSTGRKEVEDKGFEKLPDSEDYLAGLERKLERVQRGAEEGKKKAKEILKSLEEGRESCMLKLLSGQGESSVETSPFDELKVNPLLKKIQPEKQATSGEELIHLVSADQLDRTTEEGERD